MKTKILYIIWAFLFILCAGLGFIPQSEGFGTVVLVSLAVLFFLPGAILLHQAQKEGDKKGILRIRLISAISLGATALLLVINFACAAASAALGDFLYGLLILVSSPMICGRYWVVSLFLWACLLIATFNKPAKK